MTLIVHATTISLNDTGVLIRGRSGAGKSDLALQVLETVGNGLSSVAIKATLVSDDQTQIAIDGGKLFASAPPPIKGLMEVRGQGLVRVASQDHVPIVLVVDLETVTAIERMPEDAEMRTEIYGVSLPLIAIDPTKPSAASRLRVAWAATQKA